MASALLADVYLLGSLGHHREHSVADEPVEYYRVGALHDLASAQRQQPRVSGARADEPNLAGRHHFPSLSLRARHYLRVRSDGGRAAAAELRRKSALRARAAGRSLAAHRVEVFVALARASLAGEYSLTGGRNHLVRRKISRNPLAEADALKPDRREHERGELPLVELAQPRVDVSAHRLDAQLRKELRKLYAPPRRRAAERQLFVYLARALGQHERVSRVAARGVRHYRQLLVRVHRHVLQAVDGDVYFSAFQSLFELLRE